MRDTKQRFTRTRPTNFTKLVEFSAPNLFATNSPRPRFLICYKAIYSYFKPLIIVFVAMFSYLKCNFTALLFNIYIEKLLRGLGKSCDGVKIGEILCKQ